MRTPTCCFVPTMLLHVLLVNIFLLERAMLATGAGSAGMAAGVPEGEAEQCPAGFQTHAPGFWYALAG